jgi:DmsE family decaheme c-type cytochrome
MMRRSPRSLAPHPIPFASALGLAVLGALLAAPPAAAQGDEEPISREICAGCHEEAETFAAGPHGRAMARRGADVLDRACVTCHGPANEHVDDPMPENIVRHPGPDACATCHGDLPGRLALTTPGHERNAVACLDCHASGHQDPGTEHLLAEAPSELCGGCHRIQAAASKRPFAHREGSEPFACTECHSVHGATRGGRLAAYAPDGACLDCHTALAGPYVFPHPPHEVNGCVSCHEPHGSTNPRLLQRRTVMNLCLECHTGVPGFHDLTRARFRACQSCHSAVHGSNRDPRLFDE